MSFLSKKDCFKILSAILAAARRVTEGFKLYWTDLTHG